MSKKNKKKFETGFSKNDLNEIISKVNTDESSEIENNLATFTNINSSICNMLPKQNKELMDVWDNKDSYIHKFIDFILKKYCNNECYNGFTVETANIKNNKSTISESLDIYIRFNTELLQNHKPKNGYFVYSANIKLKKVDKSNKVSCKIILRCINLDKRPQPSMIFELKE